MRQHNLGEAKRRTLSIPSVSRARLLPRGGCAAIEVLSSLARALEPAKLEPKLRFLLEKDGLLVDALR